MNANPATPARRWLKTLFVTIAGLWLLGMLLLGGLLWLGKEPTVVSLHIGDTAPAFQLQDQDGRPHKLADYRTRPVAVAFLPDLLQASVDELRSLNRAIRQFDTLGVKVFAIAPADAATAKRVHDTEQLNFPILVDSDHMVASAYRADARTEKARHASYVIDGDGRVLLPVTTVQTGEHGQQLVELTECCLDKKPPTPSRLIGKQIADFRLPRVSDGKPEALYGNKQQKATVLFIMSAECPCSRGYDTRMAELARSYETQGVRFLALNASANEKSAEIAQHAARVGLPFPILKDEGNRIADKIEAKVTPEAFLLDSRGILRYHGRIDDSRDTAKVKTHDLRNALDFLLAGRAPARTDASAFGCAIYRATKPIGNVG